MVRVCELACEYGRYGYRRVTALLRSEGWRVNHKRVELFCGKGKPEYIRSDNGAEFTAKTVRSWLGELEVAPLYIERGSPWENGYVESFNGKMRDELLNREQINTLREAQVLLEQWRRHYNTRRPHSSLGYKPPAPESRLGTITQPVLVGLT